MDVITVGEAARVIGVSAKAIRLWEAKGLIPAAKRTTAGYRSFTDTDLARLRFIRQAKALGLTLEEIRSIVATQRAGSSPCDRVRQAIGIDAALKWAGVNRLVPDIRPPPDLS